MKNQLIKLLRELLEQDDKIDQVGIKISIMESTAFLAEPRTIGEIGTTMQHVNAYIENPNGTTKLGIEDITNRINTKF